MTSYSIRIGLILVALTTPLSAQENNRFGMVAIAAGQTAQVNVVNSGGHSARMPCHISIVFADRDGNPISEPDSGSFALAPGAIASAGINHPNLLSGERFPVRASVRKLESKAVGQNECDGVHATIEVFDTDTGRTTVFWELPSD